MPGMRGSLNLLRRRSRQKTLKCHSKETYEWPRANKRGPQIERGR